MIETRYFIIMVPSRMSRANYIAIKLVVLAAYSFGMFQMYMDGIPASFAQWRISANLEDAIDYDRPSRDEVEANDYIPPSEPSL